MRYAVTGPETESREMILAEQFDDLEQQHRTAQLGMWVFLATEVMLFGGLFTAYSVYRWAYRPAFLEGSHHMKLVIGSVNTGLLIASSFMMSQAIRAARLGFQRALLVYLALTASLGTAFLGLKGLEYYEHLVEHLVPGALWRFQEPGSHQVQIFFWLYYAMTGLHAVHLTVAVFLVLALIVLAARGRFSPLYYNPVEGIGLYWHLIDVIWTFLFPLFYLVS